ncbi:MAG: septum formation family protein [Acidimicrobiales bacterium]
MSRSARRSGPSTMVVGLLALAIGVAGVVTVVSRTGSARGVKYTELRPGDCLEKPDNTFVRADRVVCTKDHDLEVFALIDDPAPRSAKYPGQQILEREANVACPPQFQSYVGVPFDQSSLTVLFYVPTKTNWEGGNRRLLCTVAAKTGKLKGSVKGSGR